jgi:hypothetical protein
MPHTIMPEGKMKPNPTERVRIFASQLPTRPLKERDKGASGELDAGVGGMLHASAGVLILQPEPVRERQREVRAVTAFTMSNTTRENETITNALALADCSTPHYLGALRKPSCLAAVEELRSPGLRGGGAPALKLVPTKLFLR